MYSESRRVVEALAEAAPRPRLGNLLVKAGDLTQEKLMQGLAHQLRTHGRVRIGQVLLANGLIEAPGLVRGLSRQSGLGRVDLERAPPDPALLLEADPAECLRLGYLPWRKIGRTTIVAIADPANGSAVVASYRAPTPEIVLALSTPAELRQATLIGFKSRLVSRARLLCPPQFSCRSLLTRGPVAIIALVAFGMLALINQAPHMALAGIVLMLGLANIAIAILRMLAVSSAVTGVRARPAPVLNAALLPEFSLLVPLFREGQVIDQLITALDALDYPRELLDVKLILEENDTETQRHLSNCSLPGWVEVVVVPADGIQTKPRALNYALPLCRGTIIGVYDAEDRPEPAQLRKIAAHFAVAAPQIACLQGCLDFYNTERNWIARCFAIEYAQWFRVLLRGMQVLHLPIPLGGTTLFFRRAALERLGGWDAHNVTEDADLGIRLARFGMRCEIVETTTLEEANYRALPWIGQRSRWLKGYAITWASHMRNPLELLDELGVSGFLAFQTLFLGTLVGFLALPLHLLLWASLAGMSVTAFETLTPGLWAFFAASHLASLLAGLLVSVVALARRKPWLLPWLAVMPFYWPLASLAAWRAIAEVFYAPFFWAKTEHGIGLEPASPSNPT